MEPIAAQGQTSLLNEGNFEHSVTHNKSIDTCTNTHAYFQTPLKRIGTLVTASYLLDGSHCMVL